MELNFLPNEPKRKAAWTASCYNMEQAPSALRTWLSPGCFWKPWKPSSAGAFGLKPARHCNKSKQYTWRLPTSPYPGVIPSINSRGRNPSQRSVLQQGTHRSPNHTFHGLLGVSKHLPASAMLRKQAANSASWWFVGQHQGWARAWTPNTSDFPAGHLHQTARLVFRKRECNKCM